MKRKGTILKSFFDLLGEDVEDERGDFKNIWTILLCERYQGSGTFFIEFTQ